jgi:predicted ATP-binding protein involved in virulence
MIIKSITLENYRCFQNININFDERLTVLVGENASGKSAILDALSMYLNSINLILYNENKQIALNIFNKSDISYYFNNTHIYSELIFDNLALSVRHSNNNLAGTIYYNEGVLITHEDINFGDLFAKTDQYKHNTIFIYYSSDRFIKTIRQPEIEYIDPLSDNSPYLYVNSFIQGLNESF